MATSLRFQFQLSDLDPYCFDEEGGFKFDLATVPKRNFLRLMKTLAYFSAENVKGLIFSNSQKTLPASPKAHQSSIASDMKLALSTIASTLDFILSHSNSLKSLALQGIEFVSLQFSKFVETIKTYSHLEKFAIEDVPLAPIFCSNLIKAFANLPLVSLKIINCNLNDDVIFDVVDIVEKTPVVELDFRDNDLSFAIIISIGNVLSKSKLKRLDLRKNQKIDEAIVKNVMKRFPVEILINKDLSLPLTTVKKIEHDLCPAVHVEGKNAEFFKAFFEEKMDFAANLEQFQLKELSESGDTFTALKKNSMTKRGSIGSTKNSKSDSKSVSSPKKKKKRIAVTPL